MSRRLVMSTLSILTAISLFSSCRSARRGVRVGNDTATLKVTMVGLDPADQGRTGLAGNWLYELSGCVSALNGELGDDNVLTFMSAGFKEGLTCQLRVKSFGQPPAGVTFSSGSEQGVYYWARNLIIKTDAQGGLIAEATLQKLFVIDAGDAASKAFTLNVPVKFATPEATKPITAQLVCTPAIARLGVYPDDNPIEGAFTFAVPIERETAYDCAEIVVGAGGIAQKYRGRIPDEARKFTATPAGATQLSKTIELKLQSNPTQPSQPTQPPGTPGVDVEVTADDCAKEGKEFDTVAHRCIDASQP